MPQNSYRYFKNTACKYFPCHKTPDGGGDFNCLFCYCPLYPMGDGCGGNFKYSGEKRIKNCEDCVYPHTPDYYETVVGILASRTRG